MLRVNLPRIGVPVLPIYATQQYFDSGFEKKMSSYNRTPVLKKQIGRYLHSMRLCGLRCRGHGIFDPAACFEQRQNTEHKGPRHRSGTFSIKRYIKFMASDLQQAVASIELKNYACRMSANPQAWLPSRVC